MKRTVLITGASSGLGIEFAKIHAAKGDDLVLVARSKDKMNLLKAEIERKHDVSVVVIGRDLSESNAPRTIYNELKAKKIQIDYLINNAGFGDYGLYAQSNWEKQLQMINLNITALAYLTKLFLPDMIGNKYGKILNIGSVASFLPGPTMSVYFATKAFVLSFSEALANEAKGTGVTVTALCPGPTATGFKSNASLDNSNMFKGNIAGPKEVAEYGYKAMMKGKSVAIHGLTNKIMVGSVRFAPRNIVAAIARLRMKSS